MVVLKGVGEEEVPRYSPLILQDLHGVPVTVDEQDLLYALLVNEAVHDHGVVHNYAVHDGPKLVVIAPPL